MNFYHLEIYLRNIMFKNYTYYNNKLNYKILIKQFRKR